MAQFIVHPGTGTVINTDECWFVDSNALPEGMDIEDLASTELYEMPDDIPAVPVMGFAYSVSDLDEDIENDIVVGEHADWMKNQPSNEREFIIQNAYQILFTDSDFWNLWWDALKHSALLDKRISEVGITDEPF